MKTLKLIKNAGCCGVMTLMLSGLLATEAKAIRIYTSVIKHTNTTGGPATKIANTLNMLDINEGDNVKIADIRAELQRIYGVNLGNISLVFNGRRLLDRYLDNNEPVRILDYKLNRILYAREEDLVLIPGQSPENPIMVVIK